MSKHPGRNTRLVCQAPGCYEIPALGSDYCMPHVQLKRGLSRQGSKLIWAWIVVAGVTLAWFVLNAQELLGLG
jgi:hypothetical protein